MLFQIFIFTFLHTSKREDTREQEREKNILLCCRHCDLLFHLQISFLKANPIDDPWVNCKVNPKLSCSSNNFSKLDSNNGGNFMVKGAQSVSEAKGKTPRAIIKHYHLWVGENMRKYRPSYTCIQNKILTRHKSRSLSCC